MVLSVLTLRMERKIFSTGFVQKHRYYFSLFEWAGFVDEKLRME